MRPQVLLVWGVSALLFTAVLSAAVVWDAVRGLRNASELVLAHDREVRLQEERFLGVLVQVGISTDNAAVHVVEERLRQTQAVSEREAAFQELLARIGPLKSASPDDPVARRAADEYAGALNRRQIALRRFHEAAAAYNARSRSWQGRLACRFSDLPERFGR